MIIWSVERLMGALSGDHTQLWTAFLWDQSPQGKYYWYDRAEGTVPLGEEDYTYLRTLYTNAVKHRLGVKP